MNIKSYMKIFESYKIKKIILAYKSLKEENSSFSEDELCRRLIADRLYITRRTNNTGIKTIEEADYFVRKVFKDKKLNIEETCAWIMLREHVGGLLPPLTEKKNHKKYMEKIEANKKRSEEFSKKAREIKEKIL